MTKLPTHSGVFRTGSDRKYSRIISPQFKFTTLERIKKKLCAPISDFWKSLHYAREDWKKVLCISNFLKSPWDGSKAMKASLLTWSHWFPCWNLTRDSTEGENSFNREETRRSPALVSAEILYPAASAITGTQQPNSKIPRLPKNDTSIWDGWKIIRFWETPCERAE